MAWARGLARICRKFGYDILRIDEIESGRRERADLVQALSEQQEAFRSKAVELEGSREREARAEAARAGAAAEVARLRARRTQLKAKLDGLSATLERLNGKLEAERAQRADGRRQLRTTIAERDRSIEAEERLKRALEVERGSTRMLTKRVQVEADAKLEAVARLKAELDAMRLQLRSMQRHNDGMGEALERLAAERDAALRAGLSPTRSSPAATAVQDTAAAALFALGESFQAKGEIGLAAETYRRIGDRIGDCLAIRTPNGGSFRGPSFLIIGAARAGTTWLKQRLSLHPDVLLLAGEGIYFSSWPRVSPRAYVASFTPMSSRYLKKRHAHTPRDARPEPSLLGEKSPAYLDMPDENIELCAALFPDLRLICMVREPVSRAWSHVKHFGWTRHAANLDYLRAPPTGGSLEEVVNHGRVEGHLKRWARRFDPGQIHIVEYAKLGEDPQGVYGEVLAHIGAAPMDLPEDLLHERPEATQDRPAPQVLMDYLRHAYEGERWDAASLWSAMREAAADMSPPGPGFEDTAPRRRRTAARIAASEAAL